MRYCGRNGLDLQRELRLEASCLKYVLGRLGYELMEKQLHLAIHALFSDKRRIHKIFDLYYSPKDI